MLMAGYAGIGAMLLLSACRQELQGNPVFYHATGSLTSAEQKMVGCYKIEMGPWHLGDEPSPEWLPRGLAMLALDSSAFTKERVRSEPWLNRPPYTGPFTLWAADTASDTLMLTATNTSHTHGIYLRLTPANDGLVGYAGVISDLGPMFDRSDLRAKRASCSRDSEIGTSGH